MADPPTTSDARASSVPAPTLGRRRGRLVLLLALGGLALAGGALAWRSNRQQRDRADALALAAVPRSFPAAEPLLKQALERRPDDLEVIQALAQGYLRAGRGVDAEAQLTRWCALRPRDAKPLTLRLELLQGARQLDKALADATQLLELEPDNIEYHGQIARLHFTLGRLEDAERECRWCLARRPQAPSPQVLLAEIREAQGERAEAATLLDRVLAARPRFIPALMQRGLLYLTAEPEKAVPLFRQVWAADSNQKRAAGTYLSQALERTGQSEEARQIMARVQILQERQLLMEESPMQPDNLALQVRTAEAMLRADDATGALSILGRVLDRDARFPPAHRLLARYYEAQGQRGRAAEHRRLAGNSP